MGKFIACFDDEEFEFDTIEEAREQIENWKNEDDCNDCNDCNYRIIDENHEVLEWF